MPATLEYAFRAETTAHLTARGAEELARGQEGGAGPRAGPTLGLTVARETLERFGEHALVREIMDAVWQHHDGLCMKELSGLPERELTPPESKAAGAGKIIEVLRGVGDRTECGLDTAFVDPVRFRQMLMANPALSGHTQRNNVMEFGDYTVLMHDAMDGRTFATSSHHGPAIVYGPTIIGCGDSGFSIAHHCHTAGALDERSRGGFRLVSAPGP